jgi:hypothetical protein
MIERNERKDSTNDDDGIVQVAAAATASGFDGRGVRRGRGAVEFGEVEFGEDETAQGVPHRHGLCDFLCSRRVGECDVMSAQRESV